MFCQRSIRRHTERSSQLRTCASVYLEAARTNTTILSVVWSAKEVLCWTDTTLSVVWSAREVLCRINTTLSVDCSAKEVLCNALVCQKVLQEKETFNFCTVGQANRHWKSGTKLSKSVHRNYLEINCYFTCSDNVGRNGTSYFFVEVQFVCRGCQIFMQLLHHMPNI